MLERSYRHFVVLLDVKRYYQTCPASNDVEDELALELVEPVASPGTTVGTDILRIARNCFAILGQLWSFGFALLHWL